MILEKAGSSLQQSLQHALAVCPLTISSAQR